MTRLRSRMRESRTSGSVRGASGDWRLYSTREGLRNRSTVVSGQIMWETRVK